MTESKNLLWLHNVSKNDVDLVGGKSANLGELTSLLKNTEIHVADGFTTTTQAYKEFLEYNNLTDKISTILGDTDMDNAESVAKASSEIQALFEESEIQPDLARNICSFLSQMCALDNDGCVAVRSSATAEDLKGASYAGQQDTYLGLRNQDNVIDGVKRVFSSIYNERAISYRHKKGFEGELSICACVQQLVRADQGSGASGVIFTEDEMSTEPTIYLTSTFGLGESVVGGMVQPDEFFVHKSTNDILSIVPGNKRVRTIVNGNLGTANVDTTSEERDSISIAEKDAQLLSNASLVLENGFGHPLDIEWAKDGRGRLFILQARHT